MKTYTEAFAIAQGNTHTLHQFVSDDCYLNTPSDLFLYTLHHNTPSDLCIPIHYVLITHLPTTQPSHYFYFTTSITPNTSTSHPDVNSYTLCPHNTPSDLTIPYHIYFSTLFTGTVGMRTHCVLTNGRSTRRLWTILPI